MENEENRKSDKKSALGVIVALAIVVASAGYIVYKMMSTKAYNEKWKDYDECGLA